MGSPDVALPEGPAPCRARPEMGADDQDFRPRRAKGHSMIKTLAGKTALVTGAGAGIGRAIAELFAAERAHVIATDRDAAALAGLGAQQQALDVTDAAAVAALAARSGKLDILVNCAGFVETGTLLESDEAQWHKSFEVNVFAMARVIKAFLPA